MRHSHFLLLQLSLACLLSGALPNSALANNTAAHSKFTGVYASHEAGPSMDLSLGADGSATVTEDPGTGSTTTLFGHWADTGGQVAVTFDAMDGRPAAPSMVFQAAHDGLQAVTWDHASWGKVTPPSMKKGSKVKQLYWTTTGP
jgi:hypothetical protein